VKHKDEDTTALNKVVEVIKAGVTLDMLVEA